MAGMPARRSIAAAVEPARPPPMIAISVYFIGPSERCGSPIIALGMPKKALAVFWLCLSRFNTRVKMDQLAERRSAHYVRQGSRAVRRGRFRKRQRLFFR